MCRYDSTYCCAIELWQISYSSKDTQHAEHPLNNTILAILLKEFGFQNIIRCKVFCLLIRIIPNYRKNNGIKGSTTLMKVTGEQSTVLSFLGFSRNVSGQTLLVYNILILIHRGAKLYSQRRANLKILNSTPGLNIVWCIRL